MCPLGHAIFASGRIVSRFSYACSRTSGVMGRSVCCFWRASAASCLSISVSLPPMNDCASLLLIELRLLMLPRPALPCNDNSSKDAREKE